jgi:hypothetical protein
LASREQTSRIFFRLAATNPCSCEREPPAKMLLLFLATFIRNRTIKIAILNVVLGSTRVLRDSFASREDYEKLKGADPEISISENPAPSSRFHSLPLSPFDLAFSLL